MVAMRSCETSAITGDSHKREACRGHGDLLEMLDFSLLLVPPDIATETSFAHRADDFPDRPLVDDFLACLEKLVRGLCKFCWRWVLPLFADNLEPHNFIGVVIQLLSV